MRTTLLACIAVWSIVPPLSAQTTGGLVQGCLRPDSAQLHAAEHSTEALSRPQYLKGPPPFGPISTLFRKLTGTVTLRFVVGCDGRADPKTMVVVGASDTAFIESAIYTVRWSEYRPASLRGQTIAAPLTQTVAFTFVPTDSAVDNMPSRLARDLRMQCYDLQIWMRPDSMVRRARIMFDTQRVFEDAHLTNRIGFPPSASTMLHGWWNLLPGDSITMTFVYFDSGERYRFGRGGLDTLRGTVRWNGVENSAPGLPVLAVRTSCEPPPTAHRD